MKYMPHHVNILSTRIDKSIFIDYNAYSQHELTPRRETGW